jgi:hypothetical protein
MARAARSGNVFHSVPWLATPMRAIRGSFFPHLKKEFNGPVTKQVYRYADVQLVYQCVWKPMIEEM